MVQRRESGSLWTVIPGFNARVYTQPCSANCWFHDACYFERLFKKLSQMNLQIIIIMRIIVIIEFFLFCSWCIHIRRNRSTTSKIIQTINIDNKYLQRFLNNRYVSMWTKVVTVNLMVYNYIRYIIIFMVYNLRMVYNYSYGI